MRPLRYSINMTLDGCCDHEVGIPDDELHAFHAANIERADALLYGRVIYQMMEEAWRKPDSGVWPEWMDDWMIPFAETIDRAKKYVVSTTLTEVDWNSELLKGDLRTEIERLKDEDGDSIGTSGLTLARTLADMDLIDEYEIVVQPLIAGRGPTLFSGLTRQIDLELIDRQELGSGSVVLRYRPRSRRSA